MRLKYIRDGVDDFDYVALLKQQGQGDWALSVTRSVGTDWTNWTRDPSALEAARMQLGNKLDELAGGDGTITFSDVPTDYWAAPQIYACVAAGLAQGYDDGTYRPKASVTRDQMAVYLSRALMGGDSAVPPGPSTASFTDVPTDHWAYKYVECAAAQQVAKGFDNGTYRPSILVNRGQMAVFIARAIASPVGDEGLANYTPPTTPTFPDVSTDDWSYKAVEFLASKGVVQGYDNGTYRPSATVTRDQMAVYLARAFQLPTQ